MTKTIALRGKKEIVSIFNTYAKLSGNQDQGRPQSAEDFIKYIASLPANSEDTQRKLRIASKLQIDTSDIDDSSVPASIKLNIDVSDEDWNKAIAVFELTFGLKKLQMPYFIRVAGMALIKEMESQNSDLGLPIHDVADIEDFRILSTDEKLIKIYTLLLEGRY